MDTTDISVINEGGWCYAGPFLLAKIGEGDGAPGRATEGALKTLFTKVVILGRSKERSDARRTLESMP